jgi:hypothetical protein
MSFESVQNLNTNATGNNEFQGEIVKNELKINLENA